MGSMWSDTAVRTVMIIFGPFLFIQKGAQPESVGFALSLLFIGGAAGKFMCGAVAERIGVIAERVEEPDRMRNVEPVA